MVLVMFILFRPKHDVKKRHFSVPFSVFGKKCVCRKRGLLLAIARVPCCFTHAGIMGLQT